VPLLSDIQAANPMGKIKELTSHVGLDEQLAKMASPLAFALTVRDDSMAPLFVVGDIVIIDPSINPLPGEFVVAKIEEHHAVIFRKYRQLPQTAKSGGFELAALNGDWGKAVTSMDCSITIIGTLIEHRCRRRV
jgi:SOS-response transcriptional repressor LexA